MRAKRGKVARAKVALLTVIALAFSLCITACGATETQKELTNTAVYEDYTLVLNGATTETTETGAQVLRVKATYTNNSQEPCYAYQCFAVRAFQHDKEITDISNVNLGEAALIQALKNGQSLEVSYIFELADLSEVEILIGEPTADQTSIGKASYTLSEQ